MNEIDVLLWAAGAAHKPLEGAAPDEGALFSLLTRHRLTSRFFHRARRERPAWCSRQTHIRAWKAHSQARQNLRRQAQALREVCAGLGADDGPPIVFKGFATYALTGDERHIHWSGDIDVCASDKEAFWKAMVLLGYRGERFGLEQQRHEHSLATRRGVAFELHHHCPVLVLPPGLAQAPLDPSSNPGIWAQNFGHVHICPIPYEALASHAVESAALETQGLWTLDPSMAVLTVCAHQFRDLTEPAPQRLNQFRLGELADVNDLVRHPRFDAQKMLALADRFEGHDSLSFTSDLLQRYFSTPLPGVSERASAQAPKEKLAPPQRWTWYGCWAARPDSEGTDSLLRPPNFKARIDILRPNLVVAEQREPRRFYAHPAQKGSRDVGRAIIQTIHRQASSFRFGVTWSESGLGFDVRVGLPLGSNYMIQVAMQNGDFHQFDINLDPVKLGQEPERNARLDAQDESFALRFELPWREYAQPFTGSPLLAMLCIIQRDQRYLTQAIAMVPLKIVRAS